MGVCLGNETGQKGRWTCGNEPSSRGPVWWLFAGRGAVAAYWHRTQATPVLVARLDAGGVSGLVGHNSAGEIRDLPAPVRRYFELAPTDGQLIVRPADGTIECTYWMCLDTPRLTPFTSSRHIVTERLGLLVGCPDAVARCPRSCVQGLVGGRGESAVLRYSGFFRW